ncbi:hypothetical protein L7F22_031569 [Adiantum nelumboides]|nr:hypothetical protein [Adiantum nelumboides]
MSSKSRANSLFQFRKHQSLNISSQSNGKSSALSALSPRASLRSSTFSRTSSLSGRSSSSGIGLIESSPPALSTFQANSNASAGFIISELTDTATSGSKENVIVTVRFRPMSLKEIQRGDKLAWVADGDTLVRSTLCSATAYAFDRVFGPATTTRHVYEVAAQHIVKGAMQGINGTVFAYGVTSSGKTHTMHGDKSAHGIIPLAIENVFNVIQETPGQEFLLRVSYLEIYNEVINDLLNPGGQNLRIREDAQGVYVEGLKEEIVLSPAHCLSLIATGEQHRHVGSNNFNLLSSRSHTIFSLTIESSSREGADNEEVILSQLNLIDLAGSESSKTETTGLRRKEGSYINKSLLTLGTVISKLTDAKATHIPYRDSKLTRLLQSSLSGRGRISLICTLTPATSTNEETHNTLKFADRAKQVEIHVFPNKIINEKLLIKKYQKEIQCLKLELEQLKRRLMEISELKGGNKEDLTTLRQQMEAGQLELQTRLVEEGQAKAALLERIKRLTRLILVSTKNTTSQTLLEKLAHQRRHSFSEDKIAFLSVRRHDFLSEDEIGYDSELSADLENSNIMGDCFVKEGNKLRRQRENMLAWYKYGETGTGISAVSIDSDSSSNGSSVATGCQADTDYDMNGIPNSLTRKVVGTSSSDCLDSPQSCNDLGIAGQGRQPHFTRSTVADQMDLLREQVKVLAGEVTFCTSSLKRLSKQATLTSDDDQGLKIPKVSNHVNGKRDEFEKKGLNNKVLKEKLQSKSKVAESKDLQNVIPLLREQHAGGKENATQLQEDFSLHSREGLDFMLNSRTVLESNGRGDNAQTEDYNNGHQNCSEASELKLQLLKKEMELEKLQIEKDQLRKERDAIEAQSLRVSEEASFARELASAAALELKNLTEEVEKLSCQNKKLAAELTCAHELAYAKAGPDFTADDVFLGYHRERDYPEDMLPKIMKKETLVSQERKGALKGLLAEMDLNDVEVWQRMNKAKREDTNLEKELNGMQAFVSSLVKCSSSDCSSSTDFQDFLTIFEHSENMECIGDGNGLGTKRMASEGCQKEAGHDKAELQTLVSQLKSEDLEELDLGSLEDLYALHADALSRLHQAKAKVQRKSENYQKRSSFTSSEQCENRNGHLCTVCFNKSLSALLLPCCRVSCKMCRSCAAACTNGPFCECPIQDTHFLHSIE